MVKNFDQQLLKQLKHCEFEIKNLKDENHGEESWYTSKQIFFEYHDVKDQYNTAINVVYKLISQAVNDDVINEIGNQLNIIF